MASEINLKSNKSLKINKKTKPKHSVYKTIKGCRVIGLFTQHCRKKIRVIVYLVFLHNTIEEKQKTNKKNFEGGGGNRDVVSLLYRRCTITLFYSHKEEMPPQN